MVQNLGSVKGPERTLETFSLIGFASATFQHGSIRALARVCSALCVSDRAERPPDDFGHDIRCLTQIFCSNESQSWVNQSHS